MRERASIMRKTGIRSEVLQVYRETVEVLPEVLKRLGMEPQLDAFAESLLLLAFRLRRDGLKVGARTAAAEAANLWQNLVNAGKEIEVFSSELHRAEQFIRECDQESAESI